MDSIDYLANLFKERNNINKIGTVVGKIVQVDEKKDYAKISILNGAVQKDKFYSLIHKFTDEDLGKQVIVSLTEDNQNFIVLGYFKEFLPQKEGV